MRRYLDGRVIVHHADAIEIMATMPECSIDAVVTDPPYHLQSINKRFANTPRSEKTERYAAGVYGRHARGFMGKMWDGGDVAFRIETWAAVLRLLKPGGHLVAFGAPKNEHRMTCAIEDAGFEIRDKLGWLFASGFPKSLDISKAIDKGKGAEGAQWQGWGTALKPAQEPIVLARKPIEGTNAENVLAHGTGGLNIDACRIDSDGQRRWPANVVHDGSAEVAEIFPASEGGHWSGETPSMVGKQRPAGIERFDSGGGSALRFFFTTKADADDRLGSKHPTIKPIDLLQWLVRLVTPPGGTVLDPFAGTGTTAEAAYHLGFSTILIEREDEYVADIDRRMSLVMAGPMARRHASIKAKDDDDEIGGLFG